MKKINFVAVLMAFAFVLFAMDSAIAQKPSKEKSKGYAYIYQFEEGRTLNSNDIKFLNSITNNTGDKEAVINNKTFKAGQHLNNLEAAQINKAKSNFRKAHKLEKAPDDKQTGKGATQDLCWWYVYCNGMGTCFYVWYCD